MGVTAADKDDGKPVFGLWESILNEVAHAARMPDATILLLGRAGIGKRTLAQSLLAHGSPAAAATDASADPSPEGHSRDVAVDYAYFGARDPELTDLASGHDFVCPAACSVLILEDVRFEKLLRSRLTANGLRYTAAVVCLDLKEPWNMMEDLRQWVELLQRMTSDLMQQLTLDQQDELRERIVNIVANYKEPGEPNTAEAEGDVGGGTGAGPSYNLGIPLIVVVTRADGATALETQKTVGWSETIEAYLRSECLNYGASIIYTMVQTKKNTNVDLLYEYLMHRLYDFSCKRKPCVHSRDALFVPSGWDSQDKVDKIAAALSGGGLEHSFESVVVCLDPPPAPPPPPDECDDMQTFLKHHAVVLKNLGGTSAANRNRATPGSDASRDSSATDRGTRRSVMDMPGGASTKRGTENNIDRPANGPPATDNSSLASFFQNLLTRGQGGAANQSARSSITSNTPVVPPTPAGASTAEAAPAAPGPTAAPTAQTAPASPPVVSLKVPEVPAVPKA